MDIRFYLKMYDKYKRKYDNILVPVTQTQINNKREYEIICNMCMETIDNSIKHITEDDKKVKEIKKFINETYTNSVPKEIVFTFLDDLRQKGW